MPTEPINTDIVGFVKESDHFTFATYSNKRHPVSNTDVLAHLGSLDEQHIANMLPLRLVGFLREKSCHITVVNVYYVMVKSCDQGAVTCLHG